MRFEELVSKITLEEICLVELKLKKHIDDFLGGSVGIQLSFTTNEVSQKGRLINIPFRLKVEVLKDQLTDQLTDQSEDREKLFVIQLKLVATYKVDANEESILDINKLEEQFKIFSKKQVPVDVWPYAREIVSNMTVKMGLPPLIIPTYQNL